MGYLVCSMPKCNLSAHGAHDGHGKNLCRKCFAAYQHGAQQARAQTQGTYFPYIVGGETWEKS